ncbi:MAG: ATP-dependent sacrificial sulfur transferase LarE [Candidatus Riflebacteria bacterium]|nr:ATP-dependent sacrificial sulfur transferase LarE [Candidatus Riflebacteria bacterium]
MFGNHLPEKCVNALKKLFDVLRGFEGISIAFSGGMDSSFLALAAKKSGLKNIETLFVKSELSTKHECQRAISISEKYEYNLKVIEISVLGNPLIVGNPFDRCYHCKIGVFSTLLEKITPNWSLCDGTHAGDAGDYRPGRKALSELKIKSPLADAGIDKKIIVEILRHWQATDLIRAPQPCLATRFPVDTKITNELLRKIEEGEEILRSSGFENLRLRYHGDIARIEVSTEVVAQAADILRKNVPAIKKLGFRFVTLDLEGYKTGSMNEETNESEKGRNCQVD